MQDKYIQAIRYKLQKRVRRLNSADDKLFAHMLPPFFVWFESMPLLAAIRDELMARASADVAPSVETILSGKAVLGDSETDAAAMGYSVLRKVADEPGKHDMVRLTYHYGNVRNLHDGVERFREMFLEPFYEYIDEHIDDQQAILYFLRRYKHRCEWFRADNLRNLIQGDTQRGEKSLASDLYEYLHEQGIDLSIEPQSASGIADLVAEQVGNDRVIADAKVFWPEKSKGKSYLIAAFHQAYTYARDYNESCAYLVIYKMCKEDIAFMVPNTASTFPSLTTNNKTVFFVVIDICDHGAPASKRGRLTTHEISADELISTIGDITQTTDGQLDEVKG